MGIKKLFSYLKEHHPTVIKKRPLSELCGRVVAIDTPVIMYKYKFIGAGNAAENNNRYSFADLLLLFILNTIEYHIDCIFVLEGSAPKEKEDTLAERSRIKANTIKRNQYLKSLLDDYYQKQTVSPELELEWKKLKHSFAFNATLFQQVLDKKSTYESTVTKEDYSLLKDILSAFSIFFIKSHTEAETTCAFLNKTKKADYIYSQDSDVLAYAGVNGLITDLDFVGKTFTFIDKSEVLKELNFTQEEFIDFCILCGTDYNKTLRRVGICTAYKMITASRRIEIIPCSPEDYLNLNVTWIRSKFQLEEFTDELLDVMNNMLLPWPHYDDLKFRIALQKHSIKICSYLDNMLHLMKKM